MESALGIGRGAPIELGAVAVCRIRHKSHSHIHRGFLFVVCNRAVHSAGVCADDDFERHARLTFNVQSLIQHIRRTEPREFEIGIARHAGYIHAVVAGAHLLQRECAIGLYSCAGLTGFELQFAPTASEADSNAGATRSISSRVRALNRNAACTF